ncbi:epoxide hydrolase 1 [Cellulosimicrobium cellulans]|uniref:epoxide hydrolase family protein n=1 Tax=Cellulosimicrobium cellulans TaxID=1710 RepID=UPI0018837C13|nr:epoxide hydrolase family protein [Cellulosimicrobium cellulans]MBE9926953.1 epoxide hydrolase 1 [Cellulosimicrobium cellulans]
MAHRVTDVETFTPRFPASVVDDLRSRVRATRWVDAPEGTGWSAGVDVTYLRDLLTFWADGFDFAAHEARLAALPGRRATVDGTRVHFLHALSASRADDVPPLPLLLAHGWPDSAWRYRKVVPLLTTPGAPTGTAGEGSEARTTFDLVVPDMPGFGFSDAPAGPAPDNRAVAAMWAALMSTLGYERFLVAGGDMGSHVARFLALDFPDRVIAVHRTDAGLPVFSGDRASLTPEERDWLDAADLWRQAEGGYAAVQSTKPQTLAVGLADSPAGLAAWVVEKLRSWSDCDGDLESVYTRDEVLDLLTEHWVTGNVGAGVRAYRANAAIPREQLARRVEVPSGFSVFAGDVVRPPRAWLDRVANTVYATEPARGGHFAAFEQPASYAHELRAFFGPFARAAVAPSA